MNNGHTYIVSSSPHIRHSDSISRIMWTVIIALCPALIASIYYFGYYALIITGLCVSTAILTEMLCQKIAGKRICIADGSAVLTGLLLAFTLPPSVPWYAAVLGASFAIGIAKHAFGGLGCNIWNPALAGRAFLLAAYSGSMVMSKWPILQQAVYGNILTIGTDVITKATPCAVLKQAPLTIVNHYSLWDLIVGHIPGCIGETSVIALVIGAIILIARSTINWRLPLAFIGTVFILVLILPLTGSDGQYIIALRDLSVFGHGGALQLGGFHIFSGGLILGAFFMATDMVTSPLTSKGQALYGFGCGVFVVMIRFYGGYPEGVCYSILIMNTLVWVIDRCTRPRIFGKG